MTLRETPLYQPEILYGDNDILVVVKPPDIPVQPDPTGSADLLTLMTARQGKLYLIHRLDRAVGGVLVFARNARSAATLSAAVAGHTTGADTAFRKIYLAVVAGETPPAGEMRDYLYHDKRMHKAFPVRTERTGSKSAHLTYLTLGHAVYPASYGGGPVSLVRIALDTGRFHQIRVQFATRGYPIAGDGKYGSRIKLPLALVAYTLILQHPVTGEKMVFRAPLPSGALWDLFSTTKAELENGDDAGGVPTNE